jgi:ethanolamine utilization protein EutN
VRIGRVTGAVVSTQKHEKLHGAKLLLVQPISPDGRASGVTVLAVDAAQAGIGDKVLLVIEGRAAGQAVRRRAAPVDAAIVGVIDSVTRYERD